MWRYLFLGGASVLFLYLFLVNSSPLYDKLCSGDSAYFIMTGRAMLRGAVPYLDFFDIKGPVLFFIQALGQWIYPDKLGTLLVQIPFLLAFVWLTYRTARMFVSGGKAFFCALGVFYLIHATFESGNLTEEYCLPLIALCMYLALDWLKNNTSGEHPPIYAAVYGLSFVYIALIRVTNAAVIGAVVLLITLVLLGDKKRKNIWMNALAFLGGGAIIAVPVLLYFISKNAVYDMLYCTFLFPAVYAGDGVEIRTVNGWIHLFFNASPAIFSMGVGALYAFVKEKRIGTLFVLAGLFTVTVLCFGYNYLHYHTLTAPLFAVSLALLLDVCRQALAKPHRLLLVLVLGMLVCITGYYGIKNVERLKHTHRVLTQRNYISESQKMHEFFMPVPQQELDEVYFYNANTYAAYLMGIDPYDKYSTFQESYIKLNPTIETEIDAMMHERPPKWVVMTASENMLNKSFLDVLAHDYVLVHSYENYLLYQNKR